ncbi:CIC11C00000004775 [Sungouiella intermedia]|uniref:CIC11C00000004775 n=1 Tax=Sungouiella intermedia TaxID=45354 RepID=A0A1L0D348_9ASCO|nr:CIC11C00000004775 [[Candida] intermedia]
MIPSRTFTEPATEYLFLSNSSDEPLAFKVKTTAPKLYCVRPNASIVAPGESVKISLILQGFSQPLAKDYKCKDKFLIVSVPCPGLEDASKVSELWPLLESKYKEQLLQKKLKVNFVITSEDDDKDESQFNDTTYANATQSAPFTAPATVGASGAAGAGASALSKDISEKAEINNEQPLSTNGTAATLADVSATDVNSGATTTNEKRTVVEPVDTELEQSNARISTLSEKLDSNETAAAAAPVKTTSEEPVSGISLPFAAILVLIALLLGWYIF